MGDHCGAIVCRAAFSQSFLLDPLRRGFQCIRDAVKNFVNLAADFVVPEPQHGVPRITEKLTSTVVTNRLIRMLRTIELNDQLRFKANKICKKRSDGMLSSKLKSFHLVAAQTRPKLFFSLGLIDSESASRVASEGWFEWHSYLRGRMRRGRQSRRNGPPP